MTNIRDTQAVIVLALKFDYTSYTLSVDVVASVPLELPHRLEIPTYSLNPQLVGERDVHPYLRWHWQTLGPRSQLPALARWDCLLGSISQTSRQSFEASAL